MLFAQESVVRSSQWFWPLTVLVVCVLFCGFVILLVVLGMRYSARSRQLLHEERMRAIELGQTLEPPDSITAHAKYMHNAFWIAFWMVFAVPSATFGAAATAMEKLGGHAWLGTFVWIGAGAASIAAVVCATVLMIHSRIGRFERANVMEKPLPI